MNFFTKQKQTHRLQNKHHYQRGNVGGGINQDLGINIYTLLYIIWIPNRYLLYNTVNSTQYSVATYVRKESEKE